MIFFLSPARANTAAGFFSVVVFKSGNLAFVCASTLVVLLRVVKHKRIGLQQHFDTQKKNFFHNNKIFLAAHFRPSIRSSGTTQKKKKKNCAVFMKIIEIQVESIISLWQSRPSPRSLGIRPKDRPFSTPNWFPCFYCGNILEVLRFMTLPDRAAAVGVSSDHFVFYSQRSTAVIKKRRKSFFHREGAQALQPTVGLSRLPAVYKKKGRRSRIWQLCKVPFTKMSSSSSPLSSGFAFVVCPNKKEKKGPSFTAHLLLATDSFFLRSEILSKKKTIPLTDRRRENLIAVLYRIFILLQLYTQSKRAASLSEVNIRRVRPS